MAESARVYPYIPNSVPEVKDEMLKEVNASNISDLFVEIPEHLKMAKKLDLPDPILDEYSLKRHLESLLEKNKNVTEYLNFIGAGCAEHAVPAVCDEISGRGEFLTAYVGESYADHGKWQAFFEYCSLMAEMLDLDVLSCPLYDGAQSASTSIRMASRVNGRSEVIIPKTMSPDNRLVVENYLKPDIKLFEVSFNTNSGLMNLTDLKRKVSSNTSAVLIEIPSYLGFLESQVLEIGDIVRGVGAEFIVYTDPISLGVIAPPAQYGATFACGDFQPLGMHMQAGGGQGGFIATVDEMKYISEFKDLMFGITETTVNGEYGFGEVLFERTSYGSRAEGKEFTGTTTGLWAINAAVYLTLMGPKGMAEIGKTIMQMSQYAASKLSEIEGVKIGLNSPFFKEFVVNFDDSGKTVAEINRALLGRKIFGGKDLSREFPELGQSALFCVTETKNQGEIDRLAEAVKEVI